MNFGRSRILLRIGAGVAEASIDRGLKVVASALDFRGSARASGERPTQRRDLDQRSTAMIIVGNVTQLGYGAPSVSRGNPSSPDDYKTGREVITLYLAMEQVSSVSRRLLFRTHHQDRTRPRS